MKKNIYSVLLIGLVLGIAAFEIVQSGCGQQGSSPSTTNYTVSGKVGTVTTSGLSAFATNTVTHIVAISADNDKYLADLSTDGTFSLKINKGTPYALGFYNKTGSTITLLGYLQQKDVSWESLPIMNPSVDATNLGTVEINAASIEALPTLDITTLISQMNMVDTATAQYYGTLDDQMAVFTNLDVDSNGIFDFQEGKSYLFQNYVSMGTASGEIPKMLNGNYNDTYVPNPANYHLVLSCMGDSQTIGTTATFTFPAPVTSPSTTTTTTCVTIESTGGGEGWTCYSKINNSPIISPEVAPAGTYTVVVGTKTYTFRNFKATSVLKVGSNNGLIYPVFNLVTNEAGYITTVNYRWKKLVNGTITTPTATEIKAAIENTALSTSFVHPSPFISFFSGPSTLIGSIIRFERDSSSLDLTSYNIKLSSVHHIQASYNLTSQVVCKFDLGL
ncbi:MAG: hypothetical protein WCT39_05930 [Candidatus Margulisiibacteriota bacterium]